MTAVFRFGVRGRLRFLSHAETMRVFCRAFARAGIALEYSSGFNPHPRLSLPLPRSVGVETEDDLLCVRIRPGDTEDERGEGLPSACFAKRLRERLCEQLPAGIELLSVEVAAGRAGFEPRLVTYVVEVRRQYVGENLRAAVNRLPAAESLHVLRKTDARGSLREVDVRAFIKSVRIEGERITAECVVGSAGTIRVGEILELLGLDSDKLAGPVARRKVLWHRKN